MPKPYNQTCPIAQALDIVGDRWTLLIVRDLFLGQRRFSDLLASSPGIPPKLLSGRLKRLQQRGLLERGVHTRPGSPARLAPAGYNIPKVSPCLPSSSLAFPLPRRSSFARWDAGGSE